MSPKTILIVLAFAIVSIAQAQLPNPQFYDSSEDWLDINQYFYTNSSSENDDTLYENHVTNDEISDFVDTDGDGVDDAVDEDDDNDGILDINECDVKLEETSFAAANGKSVDFSLPKVANGFVLDVTRLDNSFNIEINGNPLTSKEIQFQREGTSGYSIQFKDGSTWGQNGVPQIYNYGSNIDPETPILRFVIDENLDVKMYGSKVANGPLLELELTNGNSFNAINWKENDVNEFKVTQIVTGPTYIIGRVYGSFSDCDLDADGIDNNLDLDSDGDGCFDVVESGGLDADNDGRIDGTGFDASGKVVGADNAYDGLSGSEFVAHKLEVTALPNSTTIAEGESTTFTLTVKSSVVTAYATGTPFYEDEGNDTENINYQWFIGDPNNGGVALENDGIYADVNTNSLTISDVTGLNDTTYYIKVSNENTCDATIEQIQLLVDTSIKAVADSKTVVQDSNSNTIDVLANDTFPSGTNSVSINLTSQTSENGGTLVINDNNTANDTSDDSVLYTPPTNFNGQDWFDYSIVNANNVATSARVTIEVLESQAYCSQGAIVGTPTANDFDGDGINNECDEDDDNDGILDTDEGCENTTSNFPNTEKGYLFQGNPSKVFLVDIQTGEAVEHAKLAITANAVAINEADNLFWAADRDTKKIVLIDPFTFATKEVLDINTGSVAGGFDPIKKQYVYSDGKKIKVLDGNPNSPTYKTEVASFSSPTSMIDIGYNALDGNFYGFKANSNNLYKFDTTNEISESLGDVTGLPKGSYGAVYTTLDGKLYASNNSTGGIYVIDLSKGTDNEIEATLFSNGPKSGTNDGAKVVNVDLIGTSICLDTDGDGKLNSQDLDSDGDGCFDVVESGGIDANNDGILDGTGVDSKGKVIGGSGGYDGVTGNETRTHKVAITSAPENQDVLEGQSAVFSVVASADKATNFDNGNPVYNDEESTVEGIQYQWYLGDPENGGTMLTNAGVYSEVNSPDLNISDVTGLDGSEYYVVVNHQEKVCDTKVAKATLSVKLAITAMNDVATVSSSTTNNIIKVLENDSFGSGGPNTGSISLTSTTTTQGGSVSVNDNNTPDDPTDDTILYAPSSSFSGEDSFEYTIEDADGTTSTATVTVTVNQIGIAYIPTAPTKNFNVFIENDVTLNKRLISGSLATGGDLYANGSLKIGQNSCTGYAIDGVEIGLLVDGKVVFPSDEKVAKKVQLELNSANLYAKIGDPNELVTWYNDNDNNEASIRIKPNHTGYNANPRVKLKAKASDLGVDIEENPVFEANVFDFGSAFQQLRTNATDLARFSTNVQILDNKTNEIVALSSDVSAIKIELTNEVNFLNITGEALNRITTINFKTLPSEDKKLIINVDAANSFNWNVWTQSRINNNSSPFVLYNFYNTESLAISGTKTISGTILAPFAAIDKTNHSKNVKGQIIGKSLLFNGGKTECRHFKSEVFTKDSENTAPTASINVDNVSNCLGGNTFNFSNDSNTGTVTQPSDPITYAWDFGDGTTSTFMNPSKSYEAAGSYTVTLTATNSKGSDTQNIQVEVSNPTDAQLSETSNLDEDAGTVTKQITLDNDTAYDSFSWAIASEGTNLYANQKTVSFIFNEEGVYNLELTTISGGCESTTIYPITVSSDEVSTGNDGGLESYSLGDALTKRYIQRKQKSVPTVFKKSAANLYNKKEMQRKQLKKSNEQSMLDMFPDEVIAGDVAHVTSPTDILDYTVADEVLSVDFSKDDKTIGVVLGVKTLDQIYNHTKATCDRLRGAEILDVKTIEIGGYNFLQQAIRQRDGNVEHAISFAVGKNTADANYTIQTNWYVFDYTESNSVFNFQVWAADPANTKIMTEAILNNLNGFATVEQHEKQKFPQSYATKVYRRGEKLFVDIVNTEKEQSLEITMEELLNETATEYVSIYEPEVSSLKQTYEAVIYDGYEYNGLLKINGETQDAFYHADGNWGLDYDRRYTTINSYEITNSFGANAVGSDELAVNRNLAVKAYTEYDYLTIYKALLPGTISADYNEYNTLTFTAKGSGLTEITLIKTSIENWNEQYKVTVFLTEDEFTYEIPFSSFSSIASDEPLDASDLTTVSFTFVAAVAGTNDIDISINHMKFQKKESSALSVDEIIVDEESNDFILYPNPTKEVVNCILESSINTNAELTIYDVTGKTLYSEKIDLVIGKNQFSMQRKFKPGLKFIRIVSPEVNFGTAKLLIK